MHSVAEKIHLSEPSAKMNEDRPILSAAEMLANDSTFCRYKVYADIRGDSPAGGVK